MNHKASGTRGEMKSHLVISGPVLDCELLEGKDYTHFIYSAHDLLPMCGGIIQEKEPCIMG